MTSKLIHLALVGVIAVALGFALIPIHEAATVHTTIQDSQLELKSLTDDDNVDINGQIEIECTSPFLLESLYVTMANVVDADVLLIIDVEIDEVDLNIDDPGDGGITGLNDISIVNDPGAGGAVLVFRDVALAVGITGNGELVFPLGANADIDFILGGAVGIVDGDDITANARVLTNAGAACTINVEAAD